MEGPFGPIGSTGEPNLTVANLKFLKLYVLALKIRRIAHEDHGISVFACPLGVYTMVACILDNSIENVIGRDREDAGSNFLKCQLDGVSAGNAGAANDGDHRFDAPLLQEEGECDSIELEEYSRFVDFWRELVGEMSDEIFGQPGIDLLVQKTASQAGSLQISLRS